MPKKRVLIVEDDPQLQIAYFRLLNKKCDISTIDRAEAAITWLKKVNFDYIFCDFNLAGKMTGEDVFNWLRENRPEDLPKFYFVSGDASRCRKLHDQVIDKGGTEFAYLDDLVK